MKYDWRYIIFITMKKQRIIGRIKECERLDECMNSDRAQLIIVYGRRRVGKTYLINEYFHKDFAFKITGIYGKGRDVAEHLDNAHHGTVVDERLVELVALAVGGKLKALGATVVGVVEA